MTGLPPNRSVNANDTDFEGYTRDAGAAAENVDYYQTISVDYLQTMGIPVVKGRGFEPADIAGAPVMLVNETLEKTFFTFRKLEAVGQRVNIFTGPGKTVAVHDHRRRARREAGRDGEEDRHRALFPERAESAGRWTSRPAT